MSAGSGEPGKTDHGAPLFGSGATDGGENPRRVDKERSLNGSTGGAPIGRLRPRGRAVHAGLLNRDTDVLPRMGVKR